MHRRRCGRCCFGPGLALSLSHRVDSRFHASLPAAFQGSFHVWRRDARSSGDAATAADAHGFVEWLPGVQVSGHFAPVMDVTWGRDGAYVVSCSTDQTTRVFARLTPAAGSGCVSRILWE